MALNIKRVSIDALEPWKKNPRGIKQEDFDRLKKQIKKLDIYKPLICCQRGARFIVLGGNMRYRAYKDLGIKEIDIVIVDAATEARMIEYALSDNDRAGFYQDQQLAELVYPEALHIDLLDFKVDLGEPWMDLKRVIGQFGPDGVTLAKDEWEGMPEFDQENKKAFRTLLIHCQSQEAVDKFARLMKHKITDKTKYIWYPPMPKEPMKDKAYVSES